MTQRSQSFAALIGTRICHDLISPIGAIGNGLELISLSGGNSTGPEMALISESLNNAQARIKFYRIAFGVASADQNVAPAEASGILRDVYQGSRVQADWNMTVPMRRPEVKLAFLLIQCLETAMPLGGRIAANHDGQRWTITGRAERFRELGETWGFLIGPQQGGSPAPEAIQFALAAHQADELGRKVSLSDTKAEIALTA